MSALSKAEVLRVESVSGSLGGLESTGFWPPPRCWFRRSRVMPKKPALQVGSQVTVRLLVRDHSENHCPKKWANGSLKNQEILPLKYLLIWTVFKAASPSGNWIRKPGFQPWPCVTNFVALGMTLTFSEPQFPHLEAGNNNSSPTSYTRVWGDANDMLKASVQGWGTHWDPMTSGVCFWVCSSFDWWVLCGYMVWG